MQELAQNVPKTEVVWRQRDWWKAKDKAPGWQSGWAAAVSGDGCDGKETFF